MTSPRSWLKSVLRAHGIAASFAVRAVGVVVGFLSLAAAVALSPSGSSDPSKLASTSMFFAPTQVFFVTNEHEESSEVDALLQSLAERVVQCADQGYTKPTTFLGVGGMKIFRDDIWGPLRPIFQADHRAYKRLGFYNFPQKDRKVRIQTGIMSFLVKIPGFRKEFNRRVKTEMIKPLQKVIETCEE